MALFINTNVASLNAQRNLSRSTNSLGTTFSRLASGLRINSAKDDAAGLAITDRMTAQIRGLSQAVRNSNDGISLSQVAEGALEETTNALQRIRELAVQSANDSNNTGDREDIQQEVDALREEIQRIAVDTEFNSMAILDGTYKAGQAAKFHIGANINQTIEVAIDDTQASALLGATSNYGEGQINVETQKDAEQVIEQIDGAIDSVSDIRAKLGAVQSRFESIVSNLSNVVENVSAARSRILDADVAAETATLTKNAILQQAGTAVLAQANQQPQLALQLLG